jgi:hypothetical protein
VTAKIQVGLIALIILSAVAAVYISVLIARRQDLPLAARRAFLFSNVSLIFCLAAAIAGFSVYLQMHFWGSFLFAVAAAFLILKFAFVRRFAHLIRGVNRTASQAQANRAISKRTG